MLAYFYEIWIPIIKSASKTSTHIQSTAKYIFLRASQLKINLEGNETFLKVSACKLSAAFSFYWDIKDVTGANNDALDKLSVREAELLFQCNFYGGCHPRSKDTIL